MRKILLGLVFVLPLLAFVGCSNDDDESYIGKQRQFAGEDHTYGSYSYTDILMNFSYVGETEGLFVLEYTYHTILVIDGKEFIGTSYEKSVSGIVTIFTEMKEMSFKGSDGGSAWYKLEDDGKWHVTSRIPATSSQGYPITYASYPYPEIMTEIKN